MEITLNEQELLRYSRQFNLAEVGIKGQQLLKSAKVLCVGAGGLGSPLLMYLASSGVGNIGIIDDDVIELSNLQRQILYTTADLQQPKAMIAKQRLLAMNPTIEVTAYPTRLTQDNAISIIGQYDIVVDGCDNFISRYIINDSCRLLKKPMVYASILKFTGQCSVFTHDGPCYRCLFDSPPLTGNTPNCAEAGVLGMLPGMLGSIQATEVIKLILNIGEPLIGQLLVINALTMQIRKSKLARDPHCPLCVYQQHFAPNTVIKENCNMQTSNVKEINVTQLQEMMTNHENFFLLDVREPEEYNNFNLNGYLIPLKHLPDRLQELDPSKKIIVHCHSGARSHQACQYLMQQGFVNVYNLAGGAVAWQKQNQT